jgi:hemerythrin superfamily protein
MISQTPISTKSSRPEPSNLKRILNYIGDVTMSPRQASHIVDAIERDHQDLKKFIKILTNEDSPSSVKRRVYPEFASLLVSHSKAEEQAMYAISENLTGLKQKTLEGYIEHKIASQMVRKINPDPAHKDLNEWLAEVKVLAELVEHHVEEEESELLPEVKEQLSDKANSSSLKTFVKLRRATQILTETTAH